MVAPALKPKMVAPAKVMDKSTTENFIRMLGLIKGINGYTYEATKYFPAHMKKLNGPMLDELKRQMKAGEISYSEYKRAISRLEKNTKTIAKNLVVLDQVTTALDNSLSSMAVVDIASSDVLDHIEEVLEGTISGLKFISPESENAKTGPKTGVLS